MSEQVIVRRYAEVLYDEAEATVHEDMEFIRETLHGSRDLRLCLASPIVSKEKKAAVLEAVLADHVHDATQRFAQLLMQRKREALLLPIAHAYLGIRDERLGITNVHARVQFELSEDEARRAERVLEKLLGTRVRLSVTEDASLIGGIVLRVGDVVYDGSVTHQLAQLRRQINRQEA